MNSKGQVQTVANQGRKEKKETREKQSKNNSAALGQGPGFPSRNIHNNTFEFCRTKTPADESQRIL